MKLTSESKLFIAVFGVTALIIALAVVVMSRPAKSLTKTELILSTTAVRGNPDARVWLVEFSDFQCPACKIFAIAVDELALKYPDTLTVAYRHYPLTQHPYSQLTARAAVLAGTQGKFWDMATTLFDNQEKIATASSIDSAREIVISLAQSILPTTDAFAMDLLEGQGADEVQKDVEYGNSIQIQATPTFYLNGVKLDVKNAADLKMKVENVINK